MTYGERLRSARLYKGWSQEDLERATGGLVKQGTISKIERGGQDNSSFDIPLAHVLDVHPKWIYDGDERYTPAWLKQKAQNTDGINDRAGDYWQSAFKSRALKPDEVALLEAFDTMADMQKEAIIKQAQDTAEINRQVYQQLKKKEKP